MKYTLLLLISACASDSKINTEHEPVPEGYSVGVRRIPCPGHMPVGMICSTTF